MCPVYLFLCSFTWVVAGYSILLAVDKSGDFVAWLDRDPTGFVGHVLMLAWPVIVYRAIRYNA